jgi:hypothetical protein
MELYVIGKPDTERKQVIAFTSEKDARRYVVHYSKNSPVFLIKIPYNTQGVVFGTTDVFEDKGAKKVSYPTLSFLNTEAMNSIQYLGRVNLTGAYQAKDSTTLFSGSKPLVQPKRNSFRMTPAPTAPKTLSPPTPSLSKL